jgi:hypothetical protein
MNVKISKEQHECLSKLEYKEYVFGSKLHGISTKNSDFDYVRVIKDDFYSEFVTLAIYLPNIHSWQYDDKINNSQYVWMTNKQFYQNLFSGDGGMIADIVLLSGEFENPLFLCSTYKIIKAYLGVAKRDLKLHGNLDKKKFHALRSLYMAEKLMNGELPTIDGIKLLNNNYNGCYLPSKESLIARELELRTKLNEILNSREITLYPQFIENNDLVQIMVNSNHITEFKYD